MATTLPLMDRSDVALPEPSEAQLRRDLAALYRIVHDFGWTETIYNHITARIPGPERHFLINPFGLLYDEITASKLVKIDIDGNIVDGQDAIVNKAGLVIHSAIHAARPDAHFVMHTHSTAGVAIACTENGLGHDNFYSAQLSRDIAYHEFEGITLDAEEKPRLLASLDDRNLLILRNHGLLACGGTAAAVFFRMYMLQRACEVQMWTDAMHRGVRALPPAVVERCADQQQEAAQGWGAEQAYGQDVFRALVRRVAARHPDFCN